MPFLRDSDIEVVSSDALISEIHTHDFLEIAYVAEGSALHTIRNAETVITKGNYFIVDYNTEHSYVSINNAPLRIINILFNPRLLDRTLENCKSFNSMLEHYLIKFGSGKLMVNPSYELFFDEDNSIAELIDRLNYEYKMKETGYIEVMRSYLIVLIVSTMRKIASGDSDSLLDKICQRVSRTPSIPPTLLELAQELGYSQYYLSTRFKQLAGIGYREYLLRLRMAEAARALANTDRKVSEIADDIGYSDMNSFYSAFKKVYGTSPLLYRRSIGKSGDAEKHINFIDDGHTI